jgi:nicotinamidase/pyrazinamidase
MKTVLFDIDTQIDFLFPAGALFVPGAQALVNRVGALNRWAAAHGILVVSTVDAHAENDPEFALWPPHCVAGTVGQQKPAETLLDKRVVIASQAMEFSLDGAQQVILEKQTVDVFANANIGALLDRLGAERYVVYGVVTEICVRNAVRGLLKTGRTVEIASDAIQHLNEREAAHFLAEFTALGGTIVGSPVG